MPSKEKSNLPPEIENFFDACQKGRRPKIAATMKKLGKKRTTELLRALPWDSDAGTKLLEKLGKKRGTLKTAVGKIRKQQLPPSTLLKKCFDSVDCWRYMRELIILCRCCCCCCCWPPLPWWKCCCGIRVYPKDGNPESYVRATSLLFEGDVEVAQNPGDSHCANINITAGPGGDVHWDDILDKPATFPPAAHDHDADYAAMGHNHDGTYSPVGHDHAGQFAPADHDHDADYAAIGHNHDGTYSPVGHDHAGQFAPADHNHDGTYSPVGHNHDGQYAQEFHHHDDRYYNQGEVDTRLDAKANQFDMKTGSATGTTETLGPDQGTIRVDFPSSFTNAPIVFATVALRADNSGMSTGAILFPELTVDADGFRVKVYTNKGGGVMTGAGIDVNYLAIEKS